MTFDNISVIKTANIFEGGKCVSHTVIFADGSKKTLGVMFPGSLHFDIGSPEVMELIKGVCRVRINGGEWQNMQGGQSFTVPENGNFDMDIQETIHYVCHFG
ncbi:unnamed protein product [Darwinula stevensoni]|uniref:Uncharacterized protein n=1 Tax=Darwinula stevensoni TaxID=69355 RepID=A0A7R9AEX6_9CRUS|nr:unnamed protein product [Darwinula stevensoni]CAG0901822.1 unnamed protein product [Darwinula stevensoni]